MFKILLSAAAAFTLSGTTFISMGYNVSQRSTVNSLEEFLREDIVRNKIYLGKQNFIEYNNQKFTSENEFKNYLLSNSVIEPEFTSSNPLKIIKDQSRNILDANKIYDLDINNFRQVYRDAFGNVSQTSQDALDTYANGNFVQERYSYDGTDWFTSVEEAKANQKNNLTIHKSLYYFQNGTYYNAFNSKDIDKLLATLAQGYYVKIENDLLGNKLESPIEMAGKPDIIDNKLKDDLKDDFLTNYFNKISEIELHSRLQVSARSKNYYIKIDWFDGQGQKEYNQFTFKFAENYNSKSEMINDFENSSLWKYNEENEAFGYGIGYLERNFEIVNPQTGKTQEARVRLIPVWQKWPKFIAASLSDFAINDVSVGDLYTYFDETKSERVYKLEDLPEVYDLQQIRLEQKEWAYDSWFPIYVKRKIKNFGANENEDFSYEKLKSGVFVDNIEKTVAKDVFYDMNYSNGYGHSVITSYFDFQKEKEEILKQEPIIDENGVERYKMWENFAASKEQLDNFLPLYGNTFTPVLKYSFGDEEDQISNDGKLLANSYQEAKELAFVNSNPSLKKKYLIADVFGKNETEGSTPEEALNAIHNKIKLQSKLVNKDEIATWDWDNKIDYSDIISDGRYVVYKLKDEATNSYIYFSSEEYAIDAVMSGAKENSKTSALDKYLYTYFDSKSQKQFSTIFYDDDINSAILEIINQMNNNSSLNKELITNI